jgi:hypothetical protein
METEIELGGALSWEAVENGAENISSQQVTTDGDRIEDLMKTIIAFI